MACDDSATGTSIFDTVSGYDSGVWGVGESGPVSAADIFERGLRDVDDMG